MPKLQSCTGAVSLMILGTTLAGCVRGGEEPAPLRPQSFYAQKQQGQSAGGGDVPANRQLDQPPVKEIRTLPAPAQSAVNPSTATTFTPTTRPVTMPSLASENFFVLGTVVAEANGQPVYADKILATIEPALTANAKRLEAQQFRAVAKDLIDRAIMEQITDELEFAAAQRNTTLEDQQLAAGATTAWRQKEITRAGGSEAVARAKAREDGMNFDERVDQQYRRHLIQIYYIKHVWPKVQLSANDMRRFYDLNVDKLYSEKSAVRFRAIRIDIRQRGGKEIAFEVATDVLDKARSGWDFTKLARNPGYNDNERWREYGGYWDMTETTDASGAAVKEGVWTEPGTLAAEELEKAVFALNPDELTDVVETREALYVAKLEDKRTGRVLRFEDPQVQAKIRDLMEREQRIALRAKEHEKLRDKKYWSVNEKNVELCVAMAMQKYAQWARAN